MVMTYVPDAVDNVTDVTAAWMNAIRDRAVNVFADDAARILAVPSPEAGRLFYYRSGTLAEGLYLANTAGDVQPPWNLPWGTLENGTTYTAAATGTISSASPTWTAVSGSTLTPITFKANRRYRIWWQCTIANAAGAAKDVYFRFATSTGTVLATDFPSQKLGATDFQPYSAFGIYECGADATVSVRIEFQTTAGTIDLANRRVLIEDIGPWGAPV